MAIKRDFRDTQFIGFAEALWSEIGELTDAFCQESGTGIHNLARDMERSETFEQTVQVLIAQRAYDLVAHTIKNTEHINLDRLTTEEHVLRIPDKWFKEQE